MSHLLKNALIYDQYIQVPGLGKTITLYIEHLEKLKNRFCKAQSQVFCLVTQREKVAKLATSQKFLIPLLSLKCDNVSHGQLGKLQFSKS